MSGIHPIFSQDSLYNTVSGPLWEDGGEYSIRRLFWELDNQWKIQHPSPEMDLGYSDDVNRALYDYLMRTRGPNPVEPQETVPSLFQQVFFLFYSNQGRIVRAPTDRSIFVPRRQDESLLFAPVIQTGLEARECRLLIIPEVELETMLYVLETYEFQSYTEVDDPLELAREARRQSGRKFSAQINCQELLQKILVEEMTEGDDTSDRQDFLRQLSLASCLSNCPGLIGRTNTAGNFAPVVDLDIRSPSPTLGVDIPVVGLLCIDD